MKPSRDHSPGPRGQAQPAKARVAPFGWKVAMGKVWQAQRRVKPADRVPNPVLQERQRRRR
jgi:hypothetical protein